MLCNRLRIHRAPQLFVGILLAFYVVQTRLTTAQLNELGDEFMRPGPRSAITPMVVKEGT
jgi:hypothetical protein